MGDEIVSVYAIGEDLEISPIESGASYVEIADKFPFLSEVDYSDDNSSFTFRLTTEDLQMRPLVKISDNTFIQFYFDTFTETLSSVRISTGDALLLQRPYEIEYRANCLNNLNSVRKNGEKFRLEWNSKFLISLILCVTSETYLV